LILFLIIYILLLPQNLSRALFTLILLRTYWNCQKKSLAFLILSFLPRFFCAQVHLTVMIACLRLDSQFSADNFCAQAGDLMTT
jgi:hypothetical protein